jgi:predicted RNA-binding Zn-ribbon protein involved in translation (DUF1610 family)
MNEGRLTERERYCPACGETTVVVVTVSWQDDVCTACGHAVPADEES